MGGLEASAAKLLEADPNFGMSDKQIQLILSSHKLALEL